MLANEPESDEWNLVDLLPKSLKSLTIQANRAQWPLMVERVEKLLQDNHDAMNNLAVVELGYLDGGDTPSADDLVEFARRRGFAVHRCMGLTLRKETPWPL